VVTNDRQSEDRRIGGRNNIRWRSIVVNNDIESGA